MTFEEFVKLNPDHYLSDVKWGEMDAFQHVNNTVFFRYFECARMAFWDRLENSGRGTVSNVGLILASTSCRFKLPLYYPDKIAIGARMLSIGEDRFTVEHTVWSERAQKIVAEGDAVIVSYDYETKKKVLLPQAWKDFMEARLRSQG
jgi:acyl-CoA thioester hydrolase